MNNIEKIKVVIIQNNNCRINDFIIKKINKFFALNIEYIKVEKLENYLEKKVHFIIFDNIPVEKIQYSIIKNIQDKNKHLYTAIIGQKLTQYKMTKIYDKHIDYIFQDEFDDNYFIAKLKNILKRKSSKYLIDSNIKFKNLTINQLEGELYIDDKLVDTTGKEYKIIKFLVKNQNNFISKNEIFQKVWKYEKDTSRVLDQYLHRIKKKIGNEVILIADRIKGIRLL